MSTFRYNSIPVLLLTGYLGSGKTTLVNHILTNKKGIRFAVIVNDIGEVNIDASLIQKGGIVDQKDDSLVALQNGCICCTLKMNLVEQLNDIMKTGRFDYIVIEASGICEPEPIARTICSIPRMGEEFTQYGVPRLDCVVTVVDALRMQSEFACGDRLLGSAIGEEDIENLIIQQVEFCNIVLMNKASEVKPEELERLRKIVLQLNPGVKVIDCDYARVDLGEIVDTHFFNYDRTSGSAAWVRELERLTTDEENEAAKFPEHGHEEHHHHDEEDEEHDHHHHDEDEHHHHDDEEDHGHHHHHHHHEGGEVEEYGIDTFVYYRRKPFVREELERFAAKWPSTVIRAKGLVWFSDDNDAAYVIEQAGKQINCGYSGDWLATAPKGQIKRVLESDPEMAKSWDETIGDRMIKLVFIGRHMDKEAICAALDKCTTEPDL